MQPSTLALAVLLLAAPCVARGAESGKTNPETAPVCCAVPPRFASAGAATAAAPSATELAITPTTQGLRITVGGKPFAEYRANAGRQPAVWPIIGPSGLPMTRSWPVGPREPGEAVDHPHHVSLWFAHGGVNGADFWHDPSDGGDARNRIVHREFAHVGAGGVIAAINDWMAGERRLLVDKRWIRFGVAGSQPGAPRWIDFTILLEAADGPVEFANTKEGTFAVRVAETIKVDAGLGGQIIDSVGRRDGESWGRAAKWVDYSGPLERVESHEKSRIGGVTILTHPASFRAPCKWHVRTYGLFAANPFGQDEFPSSDDPVQGGYSLPHGESIILRHRVVLHDGPLDAALAEAWWKELAAEPLRPIPAG